MEVYSAVCVSSVFRQSGFAYILQHIPDIGYRSLFICKPMAWVIVASINYIYYFSGRWEKASAIRIAAEK